MDELVVFKMGDGAAFDALADPMYDAHSRM